MSDIALKYMCKYNQNELCVKDRCDECNRHPMYKQGKLDGAREFAEWLPQHFDLSFSNNPDVWLDEFFNHTTDKVLAEWQKGAENV